jgi:signal transduction histidine kinase
MSWFRFAWLARDLLRATVRTRAAEGWQAPQSHFDCLRSCALNAAGRFCEELGRDIVKMGSEHRFYRLCHLVGGWVAVPAPGRCANIRRSLSRTILLLIAGLGTSPLACAQTPAPSILIISQTDVSPLARGDFRKPVFDWRELNRWNISASRLPTASEISFKSPTIWEQYRWQVTSAGIVLLLQAAMIAVLLVERHRRHAAQLESRRRLLEVMHLSRTAAASALSASIAHELNQPLAAIMSNAEAAELLVGMNPPNINQVKEILTDIRQADQRAADIIHHLPKLLTGTEDVELQDFDLNVAIADALRILSAEARKRNIALSAGSIDQPFPVRADKVHLQQVIWNLATNGMDAIADGLPRARRITIEASLSGQSQVEVSISDSGTGIPSEKLTKIFDTFYTTKKRGTGLGLSIARTIIETYGGKIWAENQPTGGAVFRFTLPLIKAHAS